MPANSQKLSPRAREMFTIVEQYKKSNQTQKAFCQQIDLPYTTFQFWLKIYRERQSPETPKTNFITLKPTTDSIEKTNRSDYHIEFPNGIKLYLPSQINAALVLEIVWGYGGKNASTQRSL